MRLRDVSVIYPNRFCAFEKINLDIYQGQFVTIVGPSGSGKTTLIRTIGGLNPHYSGDILLNGKGIKEKKRGKDFSFVFQNPVLLPWRTLSQNVKIPGEIFKDPGILNRVKDMISLVGLEKFQDYYPDQLSEGMKARAAIARALTYEPTFLLMDEPFGNLDESNRNKMNSELLRIWEATKTTILLVTHSLSEAVFLSDRIIVFGFPPKGIVGDIPNEFGRPRNLDLFENKEFMMKISTVRAILGDPSNGKS